MQIHQLITKKKKARKTVGRGGKRGTYSGRGNKGQRARSGASIDPLFEGGRSSLIERLKKVKGFKSRNEKNVVIKLSLLDKKFNDGDLVSKESLIAAKIMPKRDIKSNIKILSSGEIKKKLTIDSKILLSDSAKNAIIKAGGTIKS